MARFLKSRMGLKATLPSTSLEDLYNSVFNKAC